MKKRIFGFFVFTTVSAGLLLAQGPGMGRGMWGNQPNGLGAMAGGMWGDGSGTPGATAENRVARLALFLNLSESQKAAALKMFEAVHANSEQRQKAYENRMTVRFRIDGVLREVLQSKRAVAPIVVSRVKVMSKLDIAE